MDAAQDVLKAEGADGLTIAKVADAAGAATGALYRYFHGKDDLLAALQVRAIDRYARHLSDAVAAHRDPIARILAAGASWLAFSDLEPTAFALLDGSLSHPSPHLSAESALAVDQALGPVLAIVEHEFERAAEAGVLTVGDAPLRTRALWASVHGAAHFRKRERLGGATAEQLTEELLHTLLMGWSTPGGLSAR